MHQRLSLDVKGGDVAAAMVGEPFSAAGAAVDPIDLPRLAEQTAGPTVLGSLFLVMGHRSAFNDAIRMIDSIRKSEYVQINGMSRQDIFWLREIGCDCPGDRAQLT